MHHSGTRLVLLHARSCVPAMPHPVTVPLSEGSFDLDIPAIEAAITPRTRIVVINTPHNPTGIIYSRERLTELAAMLTREVRGDRPPDLCPVGRALPPGPVRECRLHQPGRGLSRTLIDYSYGKIMLAPGLRLGYLAALPDMPGTSGKNSSAAAMSTQVSQGWGFPDAPLQYAIADLGIRLDRHRGPAGQTGPSARGADAMGLSDDQARRNVLSVGSRAGRRLPDLHRTACRIKASSSCPGHCSNDRPISGSV